MLFASLIDLPIRSIPRLVTVNFNQKYRRKYYRKKIFAGFNFNQRHKITHLYTIFFIGRKSQASTHGFPGNSITGIPDVKSVRGLYAWNPRVNKV
jgi:hypothetical protein